MSDFSKVINVTLLDFIDDEELYSLMKKDIYDLGKVILQCLIKKNKTVNFYLKNESLSPLQIAENTLKLFKNYQPLIFFKNELYRQKDYVLDMLQPNP